MARIRSVAPRAANLLTRVLCWSVRRKMRQLTGCADLVESIQVTAHHTRLLVALGQMEMGQAAARSVPEGSKSLASIKAAMLVGCPF
jgi:hypothetical protein